ncbi:unnamed protein product [Pleuronectes platessa]|uniref:Uncharacterized protein n=1 Tax=Pleuronectes platessa TaxID=8262 RepID=A0A9N7UQ37_PLEPL|nr:unnamed protein product [Pleuronectes platessa]
MLAGRLTVVSDNCFTVGQAGEIRQGYGCAARAVPVWVRLRCWWGSVVSGNLCCPRVSAGELHQTGEPLRFNSSNFQCKPGYKRRMQLGQGDPRGLYYPTLRYVEETQRYTIQIPALKESKPRRADPGYMNTCYAHTRMPRPASTCHEPRGGGGGGGGREEANFTRQLARGEVLKRRRETLRRNNREIQLQLPAAAAKKKKEKKTQQEQEEEEEEEEKKEKKFPAAAAGAGTVRAGDRGGGVNRSQLALAQDTHSNSSPLVQTSETILTCHASSESHCPGGQSPGGDLNSAACLPLNHNRRPFILQPLFSYRVKLTF